MQEHIISILPLTGINLIVQSIITLVVYISIWEQVDAQIISLFLSRRGWCARLHHTCMVSLKTVDITALKLCMIENSPQLKITPFSDPVTIL